jgi:hypothetical protein
MRTSVALGRVAERFERRLIGRTVVRRDCLRDAVELDDDSALVEPSLVSPGRHAAY